MKVKKQNVLTFEFSDRQYCIPAIVTSDFNFMKLTNHAVMREEFINCLSSRMKHCQLQFEDKRIVGADESMVFFSDGSHFSVPAYNAMERMVDCLKQDSQFNTIEFLKGLNALKLIQLLKAVVEYGGGYKTRAINLISDCIASNYRID